VNCDRRDALPVHHTPHGIRPIIEVCGLIDHPHTLGIPELERLPLTTVIDDFTCLEGWSVPSLEWRGPQLATVVRLARPRPEATYVTIAAADFATSVSLVDVLDGAGLLALYLGGKPLPTVHGRPCRLVLAGRECFTSIKWVDRIELTRAPVQSSEAIARERLDTSDRRLL